MPYFQPVTNDDGEVTYVEVSESEIFTDEALTTYYDEKAILATPTAKKLITEAHDKRQAIKQLKKQNQELLNNIATDDEDDEEEEQDEQNMPEPTQPPVAPLDKEALFAEWEQRQAEKLQAEQEARKARTDMLTKISKEERVPVAILEVVKGGTEEEIRNHAKQIAHSGLVFEDFGANGESAGDEDDIDRIFKNMGLD